MKQIMRFGLVRRFENDVVIYSFVSYTLIFFEITIVNIVHGTN